MNVEGFCNVHYSDRLLTTACVSLRNPNQMMALRHHLSPCAQADIATYERLLAEGFAVISDALAAVDQIFVDTKFEFGYEGSLFTVPCSLCRVHCAVFTVRPSVVQSGCVQPYCAM